MAARIAYLYYSDLAIYARIAILHIFIF